MEMEAEKLNMSALRVYKKKFLTPQINKLLFLVLSVLINARNAATAK